jgi:hypothetical protein
VPRDLNTCLDQLKESPDEMEHEIVKAARRSFSTESFRKSPGSGSRQWLPRLVDNVSGMADSHLRLPISVSSGGLGRYLVNHVEGSFPQVTWTFIPALGMPDEKGQGGSRPFV